MAITSMRALTDEAIVTNQMLGHNHGAFCRHCNGPQSLGLHFSTCILFKIRPTVFQEGINERNEKQRKEANKQVLFYNDKRYTTSKQRIRRKISTRPKRKFTTLYPHEDV